MSSVDRFHGTLVDQAMIERARSVIVVTRRVDEDQAAQVLVDTAREDGVPVHLVAERVMTALETADAGYVRDALTQGLEQRRR